MKQSAIKVATVKDLSHEQWLELRRSGLGGSDASTVMGLNPYSSKLTLYADKKGILPEKEDTERLRLGRDLEDYVAQRFSEETGRRSSDPAICGDILHTSSSSQTSTARSWVKMHSSNARPP